MAPNTAARPALPPALETRASAARRAATAARRPALALALGAGVLALASPFLIVAPQAQSSASEAAAARPALALAAAPAELGVSGVLRARSELQVSAPASGVIAEVRVEEGDRVEAGQILARLDGRDTRRQLRRLLAERARLGAALLLERADARPAPRVLGRAAPAVEPPVSATAARLEALDARLAEVEARLAETLVRAPQAGVISRRSARPGARAAAGAPLFRLSAADALELGARLPSEALPAVRVGQRAALRVQGFGERSFAATLVAVHAPLPGAGFAELELRLEPSPAPLRPGLLARGALLAESEPAAQAQLARSPAAPQLSPASSQRLLLLWMLASLQQRGASGA